MVSYSATTRNVEIGRTSNDSRGMRLKPQWWQFLSSSNRGRRLAFSSLPLIFLNSSTQTRRGVLFAPSDGDGESCDALEGRGGGAR